MSRKVVLDNSVLMRAFLPDREGHDAADLLLGLLIVGDIRAVGPANLLHEFCGALTGLLRTSGRSFDEARQAIERFLSLPIDFVEDHGLIRRTTELSFRFGKRWYDMYYFAVGEREGVPVVTADEGSVRGVGPDFPCRHILLRDFFGTS
jgi:predicted nucleic acid-binding protein